MRWRKSRHLKSVGLFVLVAAVFAISVSSFAAAEGFRIETSGGASSPALIGGPLDNTSGQGWSELYSGQISDENVIGPEYDFAALPQIQKNPTSETKDIGQSTSFIARANNAVSARWRLIDPETRQEYTPDQAAAKLPGVSIYVTENYGALLESTLHVDHITAEINGWQFMVYFSNGSGEVPAALAASLAVNIPVATPTPSPVPTSTPTPVPTQTPLPIPTPTAEMPVPVSNISAPVTAAEGVVHRNSDDLTGIYILAGAAAIIMLAAIAVMVLYIRGKISFGKLGQGQEEDEFYNPDDFKEK